MIDKVLSKSQVKAVKSIPKYGQSNYKSLGIQKNTIDSLIKIGIYEKIDNEYVKRLI